MRLCEVAGCDRAYMASGYCSAHYQRMRKTGGAGAPLPTKQPRRWKTGKCIVEGCARLDNGVRGLCRLHYARWYRDGDTGSVDPSRAAPGEGTLVQGYRYITVDGKQGAEHRHIMSQHLGRPLFRHENVHHINGQRADNRLENLELWSKSQPSGQRVEDKLTWAREFLAQYGYMTEEPGGQ